MHKWKPKVTLQLHGRAGLPPGLRGLQDEHTCFCMASSDTQLGSDGHGGKRLTGKTLTYAAIRASAFSCFLGTNFS